MVVRLSGNVTP